MSSITAQLHVSKKSQNNLSATILSKHVKEISEATKNRQQANGIQVLAEEIVTTKTDDGFTYSFLLKLARPIQRSEGQARKAMEAAIKFISRAAEARQWTAKDEADVQESKSIAEDRPPFTVPELTQENINKYFKGIYDRESHLRIINDSVVNAVKTNFNDRQHVLLYGMPAVAKTVLVKRFKSMYEDGSDIERVAIINSTTTSRAGLENWLLEKSKDKILPEIIFFDEIEKQPETNIYCLLSVMDEIGLIMKTNSRIGRQQEIAKPLIISSCNDEQRLKSIMSGALWSRFAFKLFCPRPNRDLMHQILINQLMDRKEKGEQVNLKWADIVIEYAFDKRKETDPRFVKALLAGRERLEDGSFINDLEKINQSYIKSSCETNGVSS